MPKALIPALAVLVAAAAAAHAMDVAGPQAPRVEMKAWATPMAQTFVQAGLPAFQNLPNESLQILATRFSNAPDAKTIRDGTFDRLAANLQAQGVTPEAFKQLAPQARVAAMQSAAAASEAQAAAALRDVLSRMPEDGKLDRKSASALKTALDAMRPDAAYLDASGRRALGRAAVRVRSFLRRQQKEFEAWLQDTQLNIRNGAFDGAGHIVKTADGWRVGEHAPTEAAYGSYADAFGARLNEINGMRPGPWREKALRELIANLDDERVAAQAAAEGVDVERLRSGARAILRRQPDAAMTLTKYTAAGRTIETVRNYDKLATLMEYRPQSRWRQELTLLDGAPDKGYPAFRDLMAAKDAVYKKAQANALRGMVGVFAGMAGAVGAAALHLGATAGVPLFALVAASMAFMFVNIWRRDTLGWGYGDGSQAREALTRVEGRLEAAADRSTEDGAARFSGRVHTRFDRVAGVIDARYVALKDRPFVSVTVDDAGAAAALPKTFEGLPVTVHVDAWLIERAAREALSGAPGVTDIRVIHAGEPNMALRILAPSPDGLPTVFRGLPVVVHE